MSPRSCAGCAGTAGGRGSSLRLGYAVEHHPEDVLRLIAANRSPDSYVAGATVLQRAEDTPRYSADLDLFHDLEESIAQSAEADAATLGAAGWDFSWLLRTPAFHRAVVRADDRALKLEWAQDSAFRFYPVQEDERFGYRLHDADAAINKVLASRDAARSATSSTCCISTTAISRSAPWPGRRAARTRASPRSSCWTTRRGMSPYTQVDLDRLSLREPLDLGILKRRWLGALERARALVAELPPDEVGCLYVDTTRQPARPDPTSDEFRALARHRGCVRGAWPGVSPYRHP